MRMAEPHPADAPLPTDEPAVATPSPRRRWFQFRLRTLMIFMVLVSILLAAFAWRLQRARRQAEAVAVLRTLDDCVTYEFQSSMDRGWNVEQHSRLPTFLRKWLGNDFFYDADQVRQIRKPPRSQADMDQFWKAVAQLPVLRSLDVDREWMDERGLALLRGSQQIRTLNLHGAAVTNADLKVVGSLSYLENFYAFPWPPSGNDEVLAIDNRGIAELDGLTRLKSFSLSHSQVTAVGLQDFVEHHPALEWLGLRGDSVTDEVAVAIKGLSNLVGLQLMDSKVSDAGLASVAQLQTLNSLVIESQEITDQGLVHLQQMSSLRELGIRKSRLRGSGLKHLRKLSLGSLWLEHNPLTDDGLKYLEEFPRLAVLDIGDTKITDAGIFELKLPPSLRLLQLYDTEITDRALVALAKHSQLETIDVRRTKVTSTGISAFKIARPTCDVTQ